MAMNRPHTKEEIKHISEGTTGIKKSKQHKKKISQALKEYYKDEANREKKRKQMLEYHQHLREVLSLVEQQNNK